MSIDVQREARALGDPTRHRLFQYLADAPQPVGVAELTAFVGLNHNAVRQHLAVLKDAHLIGEETEKRDRPGRPRLLYRILPEAAGTWGTPGPYEYLAGLLTEALEEGMTPREVGRRAGVREAPAQGTDERRDAFAVIDDDLATRGFQPTRTPRGPAVDFILGRCPFEDVAATGPATICQLHLGLAEGFAEGLGGIEVDALAAKNPHEAGCRLSLHAVPGAD